MSIVLVDASADSLTVSWPEVDAVSSSSKKNSSSAKASYHLQYRRCSANEDNNVDSTSLSSGYETLSKSLHTTLVRKKNLIDPDQNGFIFRVRKSTTGTPNDDEYNQYEWMTHTEPFYLLTREQASDRMANPPAVTYGGTNASLRVSWNTTTTIPNDEPDTATPTVSYEIQMRENVGGIPWTTIATMHQSTEVRKKNLTSFYGYQFRIRPSRAIHNQNETDRNMAAPFSPPSEAVVALSYDTNCAGLQRLFASVTKQTLLANHHLLTTTNNRRINSNNSRSSPVTVPVADTLGGKEFILLYASAHWCGPCRQYTPKLVTWYRQQVACAAAASDKNESMVEIVFLSADHDEASFQSYYSSMPWTAIDYDDATREQLMSYIRVTGIPRLAVLDGRTGTIVEDNAVNKPLDIQRWRKLAPK